MPRRGHNSKYSHPNERIEQMPTMTRAAPAKARTKSQIMGDISDKTGLTRKEVASVFETMAGLIKKDLRRGPGLGGASLGAYASGTTGDEQRG